EAPARAEPLEAGIARHRAGHLGILGPGGAARRGLGLRAFLVECADHLAADGERADFLDLDHATSCDLWEEPGCRGRRVAASGRLVLTAWAAGSAPRGQTLPTG